MNFAAVVGANKAFNIMHSLDQVLFGWLLGIWASLSYLQIIKPLIPNIPSPSYFAALSLATSLALSALYLSLTTSSDPQPDSLSTIFLSLNCATNPHLHAHSFQETSFRISQRHFFALGAYLSINTPPCVAAANVQHLTPADGIHAFTLRLVICLSLVAPCYLWQACLWDVTGIFLVDVVITVISPNLVAGYLVHSWVPQAWLRLGLVVEGAQT